MEWWDMVVSIILNLMKAFSRIALDKGWRCHSPDPVTFEKPKLLKRVSIEHVPVGDFELPLDTAGVVVSGTDITLVGYGIRIYVFNEAAQQAEKRGISCEVTDLRTLALWGRETIVESVRKTGRCLVSHEAPQTNGMSARIAAKIQQKRFLYLERPVTRVTG